MGGNYLLLDSAIRDWVVLPIIVMTILVNIVRNYGLQLMKSPSKVGAKEIEEIRHKQTLMKASRLRGNGNFICLDAFNARKSYLTKKKVGLLREKVPQAANPMSNPMAMMDMMKGQVSYMGTNIGMMSFIGYFYSGFVCLKVPFPVPSNHFKLMLQRGVDLSNLNISYVSSLSWYFLVTFGVNGLMQLVSGADFEFDDPTAMQMGGMNMMGGGNQMGFNASAAFRGERDALMICKHDWEGNKAEKRLLGDRYPDPNNQPIDLSKLNLPNL